MNTENRKKSIDWICEERERQVTEEGYSSEHDAAHDHGELALAASAYACAEYADYHSMPIDIIWPWGDQSFKPMSHLENLIKAGALILAEIERITPSH